MTPESFAGRSRAVALLVPLTVVGLVACPGEKAVGPVIPESSIAPIREEARRALEAARAAERAAESDPAASRESLHRAVVALSHLDQFYLPALEARDRALDAHRFVDSGQRQRALDELDQIEEILSTAGEQGSEIVARELRRPLVLAADARNAVDGELPEARSSIAELARDLNMLVIKGELAIHGEGSEGH